MTRTTGFVLEVLRSRSKKQKLGSNLFLVAVDFSGRKSHLALFNESEKIKSKVCLIKFQKKIRSWFIESLGKYLFFTCDCSLVLT